MEELANKTTNGDCAELATIMNDFVLSVSDHLFRLDNDDNVFRVHEELPDAFIISVVDTFSAHHTRTHKAPCKMSRFFAYKLLRQIDGVFIALRL